MTYNRNIEFKLFFFRFIFLLLIISLILLYKNHLTDYAIILTIIILIVSFFSVTGLSINYDNFKIKKHYLFGLIPISWTFYKKDYVKIIPFSIEIESDDNAYLIDSKFLFDFLIPFLPTPKLKIELFVIKYIGRNGSIKKIKERLSAKEYDLVIELINT